VSGERDVEFPIADRDVVDAREAGVPGRGCGCDRLSKERRVGAVFAVSERRVVASADQEIGLARMRVATE
jgi:hypothetical protein